MLRWGATLESEGRYPTLLTPGGTVFSELLGSQGIVVTPFQERLHFSMWFSQGYTQAVSNTESEINNKRYI